MKDPNKKRQYPYKKIMKRKIRRIIFMFLAAAIASGISYYNNNKPDTPPKQPHPPH